MPPAVLWCSTIVCCVTRAGVAPEKLRRTPSLSALDETIMGRDSDTQQQCFVFMIKVSSARQTQATKGCNKQGEQKKTNQQYQQLVKLHLMM